MARLALTVANIDVLLVVLPPVHHDGLGLRCTTREVALLDVVDGSSTKLMRVLHVLIRDFCPLRKVRLVRRLYLTRMDRCGWNPSVQDVRLSRIRLHMNCCRVSSAIYFDLWIINNEIINIIVRNDVGYNLLIFLTG